MILVLVLLTANKNVVSFYKCLEVKPVCLFGLFLSIRNVSERILFFINDSLQVTIPFIKLGLRFVVFWHGMCHNMAKLRLLRLCSHCRAVLFLNLCSDSVYMVMWFICNCSHICLKIL